MGYDALSIALKQNEKPNGPLSHLIAYVVLAISHSS